MSTARTLIAAASWLLAATAAFAQAQTLDDAIDLLDRDPVAATALLERLSAQGDTEAMNALAGVLYDPPEGVSGDPARALVLFETAVANGSDAARANLGTRLMMNDDPADDARAVAMLQAIRDERIAPVAAYGLAYAYMFGSGVAQDYTRGATLLRQAVEFDPRNYGAQFLLARTYQNGWGMRADAAAAARHFKIAADAGHAASQWHYAMHLLNGDGVRADAVRARGYVTSAAGQNFEQAMISMAVMLALGQGGGIDAAAARDWYRRAAEAGSAHALRGLGGMLITGEGGPVDLDRGAAYLDLAAKAGDEIAPQMQGLFASELAEANPANIATIKAEWLREFPTPR